MKKYHYDLENALKLLNEMNLKLKDRSLGYAKRPAFVSAFSSSGLTIAEKAEELKEIIQSIEFN